jgi:hypothetical protein
MSDRASYVLLMSMCALGARHVESQAVFSTLSFDTRKIPSSESYLLEAIQAIPFRLVNCRGLDYIRSFGMLAICAIQQSNHSALHRYLGLYHGLVAQDGFHDESRWPQNLAVAEINSRRRVYWCMYRLEVHSASVLGHMIRVPSSQSLVLYPVPAGETTVSGSSTSETDKQEAWLVGWNLNTDLCRILEHALLQFRAMKSNLRPIFPLIMPDSTEVLQAVSNIQRQLPVEDIYLDTTRDVKLGFQKVNIYCKSQVSFIVTDELAMLRKSV